MQLKGVSLKTPSAYLFPARRRFGGDLYTMVSSFMPLFAGRIDHGHAVRFAESPERVHVVAARDFEGVEAKADVPLAALRSEECHLRKEFKFWESPEHLKKK